MNSLESRFASHSTSFSFIIYSFSLSLLLVLSSSLIPSSTFIASQLERDHLKVENQRLKQENGLTGNEELLRDFKERRRQQRRLNRRLQELQDTYRQLTGEDVSAFNEKLLKAAKEGNKVNLGDDDEEEEEELDPPQPDQTPHLSDSEGQSS